MTLANNLLVDLTPPIIITNAPPVIYYSFSQPAGGSTATNLGTWGATYNASRQGTITFGVSGPTMGWPDFPTNNRAASFTGSSSYLECNYSGLPTTLPKFSVACWIAPHAITASSSSAHIIAGYYKIAALDCYVASSIRYIRCLTTKGGSVTYPYSAALDTWHHVAATGNGTNLVLYLDGAPVATNGVATSNYYYSRGSRFRVGGFRSSSSGYFNGLVDEVTFFNQALAPEAVQGLYFGSFVTPSF